MVSMTLKERLRSDLTTAIKARDELRSSTLRMVLTAVTTEEVAGKEHRELTDEDVLTVLTREGKKRREAAEAFGDAGREEQAAKERAGDEVGVLLHAADEVMLLSSVRGVTPVVRLDGRELGTGRHQRGSSHAATITTGAWRVRGPEATRP